MATKLALGYRLDELVNGITGRVFGRIKQTYSIYKKMQEQGTTLDEAKVRSWVSR